MAYTAPTLRSTGDLVTASIYNTDLVNNILAIQGGLVGSGFVELDLLGSSAPALSTAGHTTMYYDSTGAVIMASVNGGPYVPLGGSPEADPVLLSAWSEVMRRR